MNRQFIWRYSDDLREIRSRLAEAIKARPHDTSWVMILDQQTMLDLLDVCDQAIHTEVGHEQ